MTLEELKSKAEKINTSFSHTKEKREFWQGDTKPLLQRVLGQIATEASYLNLQVQTLDWTVNGEGVNLLFNNRPSGLSANRNPTDLPIQQDFRLYVKHGGYIVFAQVYNGDIVVNISYPHIEEHVTQAPSKTLGRFRPSDITEDFILDKVAVFFDEMLEWESNTSSKSIGFASSR